MKREGRRSIVHLTTFLQGGAGGAIADLACAQHAAGNDVLVLTSDSGAPGYGNYPHHVERLHAAGVHVVRQDSLFKREKALNARVLARLHELRRPDDVDIIHTHAAVPGLVGRSFADAAATRMPVVVQTQHGWGTTKTTEQAGHDLDVLNKMDRVIATSTATRDFIVSNGISADRLTVIPCGIRAQAPPPSVAAGRDIARRCAGGPVVGCIGSVTANKNQSLLVRALRCDGARGVHAVFIGEGGDVLLDVARELGVADRVHPLGYQPAAESWMSLFDVLAVPSRSEGQGLVVLEAFRAGVPVVASAIPALRELVIDVETGWLFESDDAESLARTIGRATVRGGDRDRIVDAAGHAFGRGYTLDVMIARHEALYDEVTAQSRLTASSLSIQTRSAGSRS